MNQKLKYSINSRREYLINRNNEVFRLRNSVIDVNRKQIQEYARFWKIPQRKNCPSGPREQGLVQKY